MTHMRYHHFLSGAAFIIALVGIHSMSAFGAPAPSACFESGNLPLVKINLPIPPEPYQLPADCGDPGWACVASTQELFNLLDVAPPGTLDVILENGIYPLLRDHWEHSGFADIGFGLVTRAR